MYIFLFSTDTTEIMKVTGSDWVLANINVTGYYRVNYDDGNWDRLLNQLATDHRVRAAGRVQLHLGNFSEM